MKILQIYTKFALLELNEALKLYIKIKCIHVVYRNRQGLSIMFFMRNKTSCLFLNANCECNSTNSHNHCLCPKQCLQISL